MAFLFYDQNQGQRYDAPRVTRLSRPFSFIRTLTVGFGIAPNLLTLPARGLPEEKALAGLGLSTLTAGGESRPALRTRAFSGKLGTTTRPRDDIRPEKLTIWAPNESDSGLFL